MTAAFIPFRKGPSDRPAWPRAVGVLAGFADENSCRHPDFTVTEIGDHRDNVVTETGDHTDFGRTPTFRSVVLRSASAPFTAPSPMTGSLASETFHPENKDLAAMPGASDPPAPGQPDPERPPFLRGADPEKTARRRTKQDRTDRKQDRTRTETGRRPDRNRTEKPAGRGVPEKGGGRPGGTRTPNQTVMSGRL